MRPVAPRSLLARRSQWPLSKRLSVLAVAVVALTAALPGIGDAATSYAATGLELQVSQQRDRSTAGSLDGRSFGTDSEIYIFLTGPSSISRVTFWLDNPTMDGGAYQVESNRPWDMGGGEVAWAKPVATGNLAPGGHTVTARAHLSDGSVSTVTSEFTVSGDAVSTVPAPESGSGTESVSESESEANGSPGAFLAVSSSSDRSPASRLAGTIVSGEAYIFLTASGGVDDVSFWLDNPAMDGGAYQVENSRPWDMGGGEVSWAKPVDTGDLVPGVHTVTARIGLSDGSLSTVTSEFTVSDDAVSSEPAAKPEAESDPKTESDHSSDISSDTFFAVSSSPDRSSANKLGGSVISGHAYLFLKTDGNVDDVSFWLDDPRLLGPSYQSEHNTPFDLAGGSVNRAHAWDSRDVADGNHVLSAVLTMADGSAYTLSTSFSVANSTARDGSDDALDQDPTPAPPPVDDDRSWPGPASTGVPAGTSLTESGSITVTTDGAVIDAMDVHGTIAVKANDVTVTRTRVTSNSGSQAWTVRLYSGFTGLVIEDSEIGGGGSASIAICCDDFTLRRVDIHGSIDGVRADGNVLIVDSYIHDLSRAEGSHNDTIQTLHGENITIRHNTLLPYNADSDDPMNSAYIMNPYEGDISKVTVANNYLDGGNYTLYLGGNADPDESVNDIEVYGNVFGRHFRYGPVSAVADEEGWDRASNVFADTGEPVR